MKPFRQIVAVHEGARLDHELLDGAALFASLDAARLSVVVVPRAGVPSSLAAAVRDAGRAHGVVDVALRVSAEPEQDAVFDAVRQSGGDLLVVRHPGRHGDGPALTRRFLFESSCAVCFLPAARRVRLRRVVAGIDLGAAGRQLMAGVAELCARAGAEELIAVHALGPSPADDFERRRDQALLALYRYKADSRPPEWRFTPVVAAGMPYDRALLEMAATRDADLVIAGGPPAAARWRRDRRQGLGRLVADCDLPLLLLPSSPPLSRAPGLVRRLFAESEPAFN